MNKMKKMFVLVLIVAVISLGLTGCKDKDKSEHPTSEHPSKEITSEEHPTSEHPSEDKETISEEHPTGEHPK